MESAFAKLISSLEVRSTSPVDAIPSQGFSAIGTDLPSDYCEFMSIVGGGVIAERWTLAPPHLGGAALHLSWELIRDCATAVQEWHPEESKEILATQVLPFADSETDGYLCWRRRASELPDSWDVVIVGFGFLSITRVADSFSEAFLNFVAGFFPREWYSDNPNPSLVFDSYGSGL